jgi:hypothetical protein
VGRKMAGMRWHVGFLRSVWATLEVVFRNVRHQINRRITLPLSQITNNYRSIAIAVCALITISLTYAKAPTKVEPIKHPIPALIMLLKDYPRMGAVHKLYNANGVGWGGVGVQGLL